MMLSSTALSGVLSSLLALSAGQEAAAQPAPAPGRVQSAAPQVRPRTTQEQLQEVYDLGTVEIRAPRPRGSVDTDIPPDVTLTAEDIQTYGASNIGELLTLLEPLTRSTRGRDGGQPVMLINGRRTSGFRELRGIPSEAIERVDILPEEVALQFGYRADQRVVNFVLKSDFRSVTSELSGRVPTQGGNSRVELEANLLTISGGTRWGLDFEHQRTTSIFETERDILRDPGSQPYDLIGNVAGDPYGQEIDPALSAGAGRTVLVTPVPITGTTLANFISATGGARTGDLTAWRTLVGASESTTLGGTYKRDLNSTTQATVSASLEDRTSTSFNGLPGLVFALPSGNSHSPFSQDVQVYRFLDSPDGLSRQSDTTNAELGVVADGYIGENWRWTATGEYTRNETDTRTGRGYDATGFQARLTANDPTANPFGALNLSDFSRRADDTANSVSQVLSAQLVLNGDLMQVPAGDISSTFTIGADTRSLDSTSTRSGVTTERSQSRDRFNLQTNFNIPIASRSQEVLAQLGDVSLNLNGGYEELSDFGGLSTFGAALNWSPIEPLSVLVSYTDEHGAPSVSQLNDPVIVTPNAPVFDFATGQTVLVNRTDGGNAGLSSDTRQVVKLGLNLQPWSERDLRFSSTWTWSRTDDYIASFPAVTPDLEAALPSRFTRDLAGNLVAVDARPLNFDHYERQDLRTGFNFSRAFGRPDPAAMERMGRGQRGFGGPGGRPPGGPPAGGGDGPPPGGGGFRMGPGGPGGGGFRMGPGGGGPGGRGGGMQPGQGRFNISLYHTWRMQEDLVIAPGLPMLDLLNGDAISSRGGQAEHELQLQAGVFRNGMGGFLNANWTGPTSVDGTTGPDLRFSDQLTVNLNTFINLDQRTAWVERYPWLKGSRLNFGVQNLFDSRLEVTSSSGTVPLNYQPDFLDATGRTISLSFRKILF